MNDMSPVPADNAGDPRVTAGDAGQLARRRASIVADRKFLGLLLTGVSTVGFLAFVTAMVASGRSGEVFRAEESRKADVAHDQLRATRHKAANAIGGYAIVDAKAGRYKIPVDRAIEVVAKNPELLHAPVAKAAPAAAAPAKPADAAAAAEGDATAPADGTAAAEVGDAAATDADTTANNAADPAGPAKKAADAAAPTKPADKSADAAAKPADAAAQ